MEIDLYQRRGLYGLGDDATGSLVPASVDLSSIQSTLAGQSPMVLLGLGAVGLWVLSSLFSGTKQAYQKVARPIKRRRKRKAELEEAEESYHKRRKSIEKAYSK
jgi:hypothetical protein